jgi:hypothetical protein
LVPRPQETCGPKATQPETPRARGLGEGYLLCGVSLEKAAGVENTVQDTLGHWDRVLSTTRPRPFQGTRRGRRTVCEAASAYLGPHRGDWASNKEGSASSVERAKRSGASSHDFARASEIARCSRIAKPPSLAWCAERPRTDRQQGCPALDPTMRLARVSRAPPPSRRRGWPARTPRRFVDLSP